MTQPKRTVEEILEFVEIESIPHGGKLDQHYRGYICAMEIIKEFILGGGEK